MKTLPSRIRLMMMVFFSLLPPIDSVIVLAKNNKNDLTEN